MSNELHELEENELARMTRAGSIEAFDILLRRYEARILNYVRSRVALIEDAEDLTQSIFVKAYRNIAKYDPRHEFATWIFCIARRETISHYRRGRDVLRQAEQIDLCGIAASPGNAGDAENAEMIWKIARRSLSEFQFNALWMHYKEEMNIAEVAETMKKSQNSVKVALHRARMKLLKMMTASDPNECGAKIEWRSKNELLGM